MYPSGRWRGFWEQVGWGRQPMDDLVLRFGAGTVEGTGRDLIGAFTFAGTCDAGGVAMVKRYVGRHEVRYDGTYDGEGSIHGRWSIGDLWSGPFVLTLDRDAAVAAGEAVVRELTVPAGGGHGP